MIAHKASTFDTSHLDDRFTEDQEHFAAIYNWIQYAQYSPRALRKMSIDDLVYISGHVHPPVRNLDGLTKEGSMAERTKDHKLRMNAERAAAELAMRRNRRTLYGCAALGLVATILSVTVVAIITGDGGGITVIVTHR